LALYLAFGVFAVVVIFIDPSDDPLSAIYLVIAAMPWTVVLDAVTDRIGELPTWANLTLLSLGVLFNAAIIYALGRLIGYFVGRRLPPIHGK
jgi:membrane protein DedA with SNARE-associated domain